MTVVSRALDTRAFRIVVPAGALVVAFLMPSMISDFYYLDLLGQACIYAILVLGLNMTFGYTGQISLGHVGFWGIGAYTSALLTVDHGWSLVPAMLVGMAISIVAAAPLGILTRNLGGHYLTLATLAFAAIVQLFLLNWVELTEGPNGLGGIPPLGLGGFTVEAPEAEYYFLLCCLVIVTAFCWRWQNGRYGRRSLALKGHDLAARSLGIDTAQVKVVSLMISAGIASFAGSLYAHYVGYISPDIFGFAEMFKMVAMIIIGGLATIGGPIVGASLLVFAPEWFRAFEQYWQLIYAVLLLVLVLRMPWGVWGLVVRGRDALIALGRRSDGEPEIATAGDGTPGAATEQPPEVSAMISESEVQGS
jgi:branched-chain amino acid transport system permease protein